MERVLFLANTEADGGLSRLSLETLTAAKKLADVLHVELVAGFFGFGPEKASGFALSVKASKIIGVSGPEFYHARYATDAAACEVICRAAEASYVVSPSDSRMARVIPGVCFRMKGRIDTHVTDFTHSEGSLKVNRWYYRQRMKACLTREHRPWFLTIEQGNFEAEGRSEAGGSIEMLPVDLNEGLMRTRVEGVKSLPGGEQTIKPDAELLFVAGAGWTRKQASGEVEGGRASKLILEFLKNADASLGGSKSMVDMSSEGEAVLSFMTHLNQVGQTGSTPRHLKGLATCCHGEEPHVVGWRFVSERRAINLDPNCGWAQGKADVLYVSDAFEVMECLNKLLSSKS